MQQLVASSDLNLIENFPDKHFISKWLYQSEKFEDILPVECKDFLSLMNFLKHVLEELYISQAQNGIGPSQKQAQIHATKCVTQVINHLRNHLHKASQKYEDLFTVTLLYPFKYDASEKIFFCLLLVHALNSKRVEIHKWKYGVPHC